METPEEHKNPGASRIPSRDFRKTGRCRMEDYARYYIRRVGDFLIDYPALLFLWLVFAVKVILPVTSGMKKLGQWLGIKRLPE
jgi:hypothetical protein